MPRCAHTTTQRKSPPTLDEAASPIWPRRAPFFPFFFGFFPPFFIFFFFFFCFFLFLFFFSFFSFVSMFFLFFFFFYTIYFFCTSPSPHFFHLSPLFFSFVLVVCFSPNFFISRRVPPLFPHFPFFLFFPWFFSRPFFLLFYRGFRVCSPRRFEGLNVNVPFSPLIFISGVATSCPPVSPRPDPSSPHLPPPLETGPRPVV